MKGARTLPNFNLRMPKADMDLVKKAAEMNGRSINSEIYQRLMSSLKKEGIVSAQ
ncbi:Arc family DNA-binding protein [Enterobacter hormaechei]|uniref:Arc family DNA-binding protein n=1 Tax=Enterobacter hormaechei TaxID=158836 RepID=UPI000F88F3F8|nr:Arc family DNA-binding protein [Enterobacter hormaechei]RUO07977.1 Arc family DNA-binding protein [Enterobacter hormaechei]